MIQKERLVMRRNKMGFSLIELLVTIGIVVLAATMLVPGYQRFMEGGKQTACLANMRGIAQASLAYHADQQTILPWYTRAGGYWWQMLTPYLGGDERVFHCPADKSYQRHLLDATISYGWNYYLAGHGDLNDPDLVRAQRYSYPSRTLIMADGPGGARSGQEDSWGYIDERAAHTPDPTRHLGLGNALFLDGHIEKLRTTEFINNDAFRLRDYYEK